MALAVSRQPLSAEARIGSQVSLYEICGGHSGTGTGFSESTSAFDCQYHSINASYSSSSTHFSYQKDKQAKPENLPKGNAPLCIGQHWIEKYFHFFFSLTQI
jgi:hypothetical protein